MRLRSWLLFLLTVLLWSANWSVMKRGLGLAPPFTFVLHRFLLSFGALVVLLLFLRPSMPRYRDTLGKIMVLSIFNVASLTAMNLGLSSYRSGIGAVLTYTQPLFVFGLAVLFLKGETSKSRLTGTILGFLGVSVLSLETSSSITLSLSAAVMILGAFFWAANIVYYKRFLHHVDPVFLNALQTAVGLPFLAVFSLALERPEVSFSAIYMGIILYTGIGASAIGSTLWLVLLKDEDATALAGSSFMVPIMALGFGWWLLGEALDTRSVIGTILVLSGVYLVNRKVKKHGRANDPARSIMKRIRFGPSG